MAGDAPAGNSVVDMAIAIVDAIEKPQHLRALNRRDGLILRP